jgi:cyclase
MELIQIGRDLYACMQPEGGFGASNSGLVARDGGLVIDTFWDLPRTRSMKRLYESVSPDPVRRLVNTHHNGDHTWGNQLFAEVGTEIIGHRRCVEAFTRESPELLQRLAAAENLPPGLELLARALRRFDFSGITLTPPTTVLDEDIELDLGGSRVQVISVGPAHTAGDVVVYLPDDGVLFTGDVLFNQCTPVGWDGTFAQWCAALDRLAELGPEVVVPGHGPTATVADLVEMKAYLDYVLAESRQHYDAGRSTLDAALRLDISRWSHWEEPYRLAFHVDRAYREFAGLPWDTSVEVVKVFADAGELDIRYRAEAAASS